MFLAWGWDGLSESGENPLRRPTASSPHPQQPRIDNADARNERTRRPTQGKNTKASHVHQDVPGTTPERPQQNRRHGANRVRDDHRPHRPAAVHVIGPATLSESKVHEGLAGCGGQEGRRQREASAVEQHTNAKDWKGRRQDPRGGWEHPAGEPMGGGRRRRDLDRADRGADGSTGRRTHEDRVHLDIMDYGARRTGMSSRTCTRRFSSASSRPATCPRSACWKSPSSKP